MNERKVFVTALEKEDSVERKAYLDEACAGDAALRARVEALLRSHEREGKFLDVPAVEQLAAPGLQPEPAGNTQAEAPRNEDDGTTLDFLEPSDKPGVLGRLGHYDILEVIGKGGMGVVLRAFDDKLHRVVAIKVMAAQLATNGTARRRFAREAQAAAAVSHDHIVTIHAVEEASPLPYLVMHYVAGFSLQQRLDRDGPLELQEILRIGMQTASALAAAHAQGLIHRDVKPANILLENGVERVRITDFGLARAATEASLTQSGVVAGTPQYMSPEQAEGKAIDQRTDLFSLGSVLYAMCTGRAPFRASGSMAVLKRVCEETPTPIRETNAEIPDWLVAIIDKLHAKNPAQRYQSATEVAELLARHLAHVQHPSVAPLPVCVARPESSKGVLSPTPFEDSGRATQSRRRLALAAAVVLCFVGALSLTEATGVTNLRATVIRIFTPDGTLVVEVDDPGVKVTIEGDGGIVITGAGPQEVRLRPGSYKLQADKDGKRVPLERELVSIAKGGREVVRVKLEVPPAQAAAKAEKGAFVLLIAGKERKFDTLAEAVVAASDGDTIEIHGNGPFVTHPIVIGQGRRVIRAGAGYRPVIRFVREESDSRALINSDAALTLEGLDFQGDRPGPKQSSIAIALGPSLHVANCRFHLPDFFAISAQPGRGSCVAKNCEFLGCHRPLWNQGIGTEWVVDNCIQVGGGATMGISLDRSKAMEAKITRLTNLANHTVQVIFADAYPPDPDQDKNSNRLHLKVSSSVLAGDFVLETVVLPGRLGKSTRLGSVQYETVLQRLIKWDGENNLYSIMPNSAKGGPHFLLATLHDRSQTFQHQAHGPQALAAWRKFWQTTEIGSIENVARFKGGDVSAKHEAAPEKLTADDFRLRPDSAGYRAGKDGKDLGADVELVGPGPAYERWKKTPEYQQWLKDTKQVKKAEGPKAESKAFVLLGGKGVEVRKYDTLAEAVRGSSAGDTIEIRGNGPFVSDEVTIRHPLVIRAGEGYTPSLTLSQAAAGQDIPLLTRSASLVLEGLDLRPVGRVAGKIGGRVPVLIDAWHGGALHVANCRLTMKPDTLDHIRILMSTKAANFTLRNSELSGRVHSAVDWRLTSGSSCTIENCVCAIGGIGFGLDDGDLTDVSIRVRGNTFVGRCMSLTLWGKPNLPEKGEAPPPIGLNFSRNVTLQGARFRHRGVLYIHQYQLKPPFSAAEAEALLPRLVRLDEHHNVHLDGTHMLRLASDWKPLEGTRGHDLTDWNRFWDQQNTGSVEGNVRFQGGDLIVRAQTTPEKLTAEDFRLRPDSAGYRAGKDGKDLGADIDLVGPGKAYERWKKTPAYQQWLKDTKQVKK